MLGRMFGAGLGWAFAGPIGGLIGWWLGSRFDADSFKMDQNFVPPGTTKPGDFAIALLVLLAAVMKADGKVVKAELDFVKQFLIRNFGRENAQEMLLLLKNLLEQDYYVYEVAGQINQRMNTAEKLELMHVLYGISQADGEVHTDEVDLIREIGGYLHLNQADVDSILSMGKKSTNAYYKVLEVDSSATDQEVKKAYRSMAAKFHPDKVQHLGPDFQKMAEEKFKSINEAYQNIKSERGFS